MSVRITRWPIAVAAMLVAGAATAQSTGSAGGQTGGGAQGNQVSIGGGGVPAGGQTCVALPGQRTPSTDNLAIDAGFNYTDNILLSSINRMSQTSADLGLLFSKNENRPHYCGDIDADLHFLDYLNSSFPRQLLGGAAGTFNLFLVPGRLSWLVEDNFGQVAQNPQEVGTPLNRQNFNYLTTGPKFTQPVSSRLSLVARVLYQEVDFQHSDSNTRGVTESVAVADHLSSRDTLSLETTASQIQYTDLIPKAAYDIYQAYARFVTLSLPVHQIQTQGRGGIALTADLGEGVLRYSGLSEHGVIARIAAVSPTGAFSQLSLNAGSEFSDTAGVFALDQANNGIVNGNDQAAVANSPFRLDYGYLTWSTTRIRTSLSISANWNKEIYPSGSTPGLSQYGAKVTLTRLLTQTVSADLDGSWSRNSFGSTGDVGLQQRALGAGISWKFARRWEFAGHAYRLSGGSPIAITGSGVTGGGYHSLSAYASVRYAIGSFR
jgi:hypothetical protein